MRLFLMAFAVAAMFSAAGARGGPAPGQGDGARPVLPDPSGGEINGRVAMLFWPSTAEGPESRVKGCTVHLILTDDQAKESVYPCGEWFQPVPSRYLQWLEAPGRVSYQTITGFAGEAFHGKGFIGLSVLYPAASVSLDPDVKVKRDDTFRIVSLGTTGSMRMFDRRIAAEHAGAGPFQVPAGPVIAGIFDGTGHATALSRPVPAGAGSSIVVSPAKPRKGGDALIVIDRLVSKKQAPARCDVKLVVKGRDLKPDASVITPDRLLYIWYEADPGAGRFSLRCGGKSIDRELSLRRGEIVTLRDELP